MLEKFKVEFLPEAVDFMESLDKKSQKKYIIISERHRLQMILNFLKN